MAVSEIIELYDLLIGFGTSDQCSSALHVYVLLPIIKESPTVFADTWGSDQSGYSALSGSA
jgi:hypothetical protein